MPVLIPVIGRPPTSPRYPKDARGYEWSDILTIQAIWLWETHFTGRHQYHGNTLVSPLRSYLPHVYWSSKIGRTTLVHAKCFAWGIVLSQAQYRRVAWAKRVGWLRRVLLHELLHFSGYHGHGPQFRAAAKQLGTW